MNYLKNNIEHFFDFIKYIWERILCIVITLLIIIAIILLLLQFSNIKNPKEIESQQILINNISLDNWVSIITVIGLIITAIWSMYQYTKNKALQQQEKSAQIAKIFSDNLLEKCGIIIHVFKHSKLNNIVEYVSQPANIFQNFTTNELREIFENDDFPNIYKKIKNNSELDDLYYSYLESKITVENEYLEKYKDPNSANTRAVIKLHHYTTEEATVLFKLNNANLPFHFSDLIDNVLNELEYICMNISSNAANSIYIYQSLHQMFFDTINCLAVEISLRNDGKYSDKFYTNIIHVYTNWKKIYNKKLEKENYKKHKNIKMLTPKIEKI